MATNVSSSASTVTLGNMKLRRGDWKVFIISSMEQIIGTALSTVVGIIIPLLVMVHAPEGISSSVQGIIGASGLVGISIGAMVLGPLIDRQGYLQWFRLCPVIITIGGLLPVIVPEVWSIIAGMFIAGLGIGGGYDLDSAYISEIMPDKWKHFMVGLAKATCAIGFTLAAGLGWWIVKTAAGPEVWPWLSLIIVALGVLTFAMRINWRNSPVWLAHHGRMKEAQEAVEFFVGKGVTVEAPQKQAAITSSTSYADFFRGKNLLKVIYSGLTWACEGLGVYGFGVFLPVLVMALGIDSTHLTGMDKVINSVEMTFYINLFIIPGFALGLWLMRHMNHAVMMGVGFFGCVVGLALLAVAYTMHLPVAVSIIGFLIFELSLQGGPHLITYIIPSAIYDIGERGTGTGIASMLGKVGAVLGVFFMPVLLHTGGMMCVLWVSMGVMLAGGLITFIFGKMLNQL